MELSLKPLETSEISGFWQLAHRSQSYENPFGALIAQTNRMEVDGPSESTPAEGLKAKEIQ